MGFEAFKDQLLIGVVSILVILLGFIGRSLLVILDEIKVSMIELNTRIAVVIERTDNHEKRLDKLEEKI